MPAIDTASCVRLDTQIEFVPGRTARARLYENVLHVRMPQHWPADYRAQTIARFERWGRKQLLVASTLPSVDDVVGRSWSTATFDAYVRQINDASLKVALRGVRIGQARRTRLAQANTRTGVLTFSRFAIDGMPERALRYLILHELAHLIEANHSARFWALVAEHEPDYKRQRAIAQAHHARMVDRGTAAPVADQATGPTSVAMLDLPSPSEMAEDLAAAEGHPFGPLFGFVASFDKR